MEVGLQFAKDLSIQDFIIEGDSLLVINALKELSPPPSSVAAIISNSLLVSQEFRQVVFSHVCRQSNRPAHLLAKYAFGIDDFSVWLEEEPCFLNQALIQDVTLLWFNKVFSISHQKQKIYKLRISQIIIY